MTKTFLRLRFDLSDECLEYIEKGNEASRTNTNREFDQNHSENINGIISLSEKLKSNIFFIVVFTFNMQLIDAIENPTNEIPRRDFSLLTSYFPFQIK